MRSVIAILIFFGAIQGFALCINLYFKEKNNKKAFKNYFLFLFSLSFFNLLYALKFLDIFNIGFIPLSAFPLPYKYLIGVGFYFYIKNQIPQQKASYFKPAHLLFLPALFYGLLRTYWYVMLHSGMDKDINLKVYQSGFFIYNEYVYLLFNLVLTIFSIKFLKENKTKISGFNVMRKNWEWLLKFSNAFMVIILANILLAILVHVLGDPKSGTVYVIILILNSIYIYWVGIESLTRSKFLFNTFTLKDYTSSEGTSWHPLSQSLEHLMNEKEVFSNKNLKISHLASLLDTTDRELSLYIHESYGVSFTEYINQLRVEKVKRLINKGEQEKYTLFGIAEKAGFSSKSSFNEVFKKVTGLTPTQYKASHKS
ncbi:helix-turn-helix domain-containing protein [uncultured Croceitalea sp.]|uniref:helix-turn-helix domain-containing protein n=1 Tax=uncultured Croceitalea sp. TaxID=1798908 RepID=UPI003305D8C4